MSCASRCEGEYAYGRGEETRREEKGEVECGGLKTCIRSSVYGF